MQIAEISYSLQGEGQLTGVPSIFIRTSGTSLRNSVCSSWPIKPFSNIALARE
jgi:7-carboxy-7-deazaguanine synthase